MKLLTRQILANEAAERWRLQYPPDGIKDGRNYYQELLALGPNPNPDDIDNLIGNLSWTMVPSCDECRREVEPVYGHHTIAVVQLGEAPDYESRTACICGDCLFRAIQLIDG